MVSVYISGPITGTDDYMERFKEAEAKLREAGYDPVNPAEINSHLPEDTSWETYMGQSLKLLCGLYVTAVNLPHRQILRKASRLFLQDTRRRAVDYLIRKN